MSILLSSTTASSDLAQVDWAVVGALANLATALIAFLAAVIVIWQVWDARRAAHASSFKVAYDILQDEEIRGARRVVMAELRTKDVETWTAAEVAAAERVCQSYDSVAIMCRLRYLPTDVIADSWGDSIRKTWRVVLPLVEKYRVERDASEFWDDFEWLAQKAQAAHDSAA